MIEVAHRHRVDAIIQATEFLSEHADFARACELAWHHLSSAPRRNSSKRSATRWRPSAWPSRADYHGFRGTATPCSTGDVRAAAKQVGYPIIIKASFGGGGQASDRQTRELRGSSTKRKRERAPHSPRGGVRSRRYVRRAKHIEVQISGPARPLVHLWERDCSVQRRHRKWVEIAPASMSPSSCGNGCAMPPFACARRSGISLQAPLSFWWTWTGRSSIFIEVNPRIQVEHTVTEMVTASIS